MCILRYFWISVTHITFLLFQPRVISECSLIEKKRKIFALCLGFSLCLPTQMFCCHFYFCESFTNIYQNSQILIPGLVFIFSPQNRNFNIGSKNVSWLQLDNCVWQHKQLIVTTKGVIVLNLTLAFNCSMFQKTHINFFFVLQIILSHICVLCLPKNRHTTNTIQSKTMKKQKHVLTLPSSYVTHEKLFATKNKSQSTCIKCLRC